MIIYIVILVAAACIGLLFILDKSKSTFDDKLVKEGEEGHADLKSALHSELSRLPIPAARQEQVARTLSIIVDKEVHKKAAFLSQEVGKKYAQMLDEREKKMQHLEERYHVTEQRLETVNKNFKKTKIEKKQTEAVMRSIAEGLIVVNEKGETLLMNPAAEKLLGISKEEAMGKSVLNAAKDEQMISLAQAREGQEEKEITLNSKNEATRKILRQSTAVIENEAGQTMGMVSVLTDVTKQKELEEMKTRFVSNVTHELRTPLAAIKESVNLFMDQMMGNITPEQEKVLSIAKRNIQRLARLIDDILDISKLEAGKLRLRPIAFQLEDLISPNVKQFDAWAATKVITLTTTLPPEPVEVFADQDRLSQVITNLVGNAMKFTPNGGKITLEVKKIPTLSATDPQPALEFCIHDSGPGIAQKDMSKMFQKFGQGSAKPVDKISGTGLGLAISKEVVELHQGRIWVTSEEGFGARFYFVIPQKVTVPEE